MRGKYNKYSKIYGKELKTDSQLHQLLAFDKFSDFQKVLRDKNRTDNNVYKQILAGETALHLALAKKELYVVNNLLNIYENDLNVVKDYVTEKNAALGESKFWLNRNILVIYGDEKMRRVKAKFQDRLDTVSVDENSLLLILKHNNQATPQVMSLNPKTDEEIELVHEIYSKKFVDGSLNLNYHGPKDECDSLLHIAVYCGLTTIISRLVGMGATINNRPNRQYNGNHSPFATACLNGLSDTVTFMLDHWIDDIDLYEKHDEYNSYILHMTVQHRQLDIFKILFNRMREHRKLKLNESDEEAANYILSLTDNYTYSILLCLMHSHPAYFETEILHYNPDFTIKDYYNTPILHKLIKSNKSLAFTIMKDRAHLLMEADEVGLTSLHVLMLNGCLTELKYFLEQDPKLYDFLRNNVELGRCACKHLKKIPNMMEFVQDNFPEFIEVESETPSAEVVNNANKDDDAKDKDQDDITKSSEIYKALDTCKRTKKNSVVEEFLSQHDFSILKSYDTSIVFKLLEYIEGSQHISKYQREIIEIGTQTTNKKKYTLLHLAVINLNDYFVDQLLLFNPSLMTTTDAEGNIPLHYIKNENCLNAFKKHVSDSAEWKSLLETKCNDGLTVLLNVIWSNVYSVELLQELLALGADVKAKTNSGKTCLHFSYHDSITKVLLDNGADINAADKNGDTALHLRLRNKWSTDVILLNDPSLNYMAVNNDGHSYLSYLARFHGADWQFQKTLEANESRTTELFKVHCNGLDKKGTKIILYPIIRQNLYFLKKLFEQETLDVNILSDFGNNSLLHEVLRYGGSWSRMEKKDPKLNEFMVDVIIKGKVDLNHMNDEKEPPLHYAVRYNQSNRIIHKLITNGADLNYIHPETGNSFLHTAAIEKNSRLLHELLKLGLEYTLKNKDNKTPYDLCSERLKNYVLPFMSRDNFEH